MIAGIDPAVVLAMGATSMGKEIPMLYRQAGVLVYDKVITQVFLVSEGPGNGCVDGNWKWGDGMQKREEVEEGRCGSWIEPQ